jgi:hypothetical protein
MNGTLRNAFKKMFKQGELLDKYLDRIQLQTNYLLISRK